MAPLSDSERTAVLAIEALVARKPIPLNTPLAKLLPPCMYDHVRAASRDVINTALRDHVSKVSHRPLRVRPSTCAYHPGEARHVDVLVLTYQAPRRKLDQKFQAKAAPETSFAL